MKAIRTDVKENEPDGPERGSCAIYLSARKQGQSTFGTLKRALGALVQMGHRTGFVNGEGDGAGVQTDIPRRLWTKKLSQSGLPSYLATQPGFWVGHIFIPHNLQFEEMREKLSFSFNQAGLNMLVCQPGRVRPEALGQSARHNPPSFWQIAGYCESPDLEKILLNQIIELEKEYPVHFASLSSSSVVYKIRGSVECLSRYYPDLQDRNYDTAMVLSHARYSTNTVSSFERAQPFAIIGHNGEINTINRLRHEARQIGVTLPRDGSDSQDIDRTLHTLCSNFGMSLIDAMEIIFPPTPSELNQLPPDLVASYRRIRQSFGPYAQGPAGIVARYGNTIVASVDALGLRPLWFIDTEKEYVFSSERGAIPLEIMINDPHPFSPGEKMAIQFHRGENAVVYNHTQIRQQVLMNSYQREAPQLASRYWADFGKNPWNIDEHTGEIRRISKNRHSREEIEAYDHSKEDENLKPDQENQTQNQQLESSGTSKNPKKEKLELPWVNLKNDKVFDLNTLVANGWLQDHLRDLKAYGKGDEDDLVCSLGYDGPLAALSSCRENIADYFKESVAVVTNPAIDQTRESEAFSTSSLIGARPMIGKAPDPKDKYTMIGVPIVLGGFPEYRYQRTFEKIAHDFSTLTIEELVAVFDDQIQFLTMGVMEGETVHQAIQRLEREAILAAGEGIQCLVLDDSPAITGEVGWLDPHLATSALDDILRQIKEPKDGKSDNEESPNSLKKGIPDEIPANSLRRQVGIIVRSAAIRTLHDIALLCGLGADAINPYMMVGLSIKANELILPENEVEELLSHWMLLIKKGLEKTISTMGCHELRGYGRVFSSIGLAPGVAEILKSPNYFGNEEIGLTWQRLEEDSRQRQLELQGGVPGLKLSSHDRYYPKFWRKVSSYTKSEAGYGEIRKTYLSLAQETPVSLRHLVQIKKITDVINPADVDLTIQENNLPFVIDAMSFGSQGEVSYKAYAQAASLLNILCINGEGGELPEIMGVYKKNRGQQVASGRFGVNVEFLNSALILEIKIGQGAKPGEGGMLPGWKITPQVARARHTPPNVTLLSPSNNHDLYSIEDLAQLIEELRMVNPEARISVKVPVVPGIGVIAVGIAKAGADIINLSGYDGGTGAARKHSVQYVGLPAEIGVIQAHRALVEAGIRHKVELWCNGGMKTGEDVVKMILLGANRVGFATMAMVAIGCIVCRHCNLGDCVAGIATQTKTLEEAKEKGIKGFVPLNSTQAVDRLVRLFKGIGEEVRMLTAQAGGTSLQDLVGRADLLEQIYGKEKIDLSAMFQATPDNPRAALEPGVGILLIRPRNSLTSISSELIVDTILGDEREVTYQDTVMAYDRALGARLAGELLRRPELRKKIDCLHLRFGPSSLAGNGFAAWVTDQIDILIEGGAQDGVAKGASGGRVAVMKGINHDGARIDGSVGKSFAYGAQKGILIVQGNADSRACVRLSGADVVLGGEITMPINDREGSIGTRSNLKGFACEYMTHGNVIILGDPGPYAFSGMTGGTIYQMMNLEMGFDEQVLKRRMARGASVRIMPLEEYDASKVKELLGHYINALEQTYQYDTAEHIRGLSEASTIFDRFVKIVPFASSPVVQ
jgi:glutamate synthase (NADPH) large chain